METSVTNRLRHALPVALLSFALLATGCKKKAHLHQADESSPDYTASLQADVNSRELANLRWPDFSDYRKSIAAFYQNRDWLIAWSNAGNPTSQAQALIRAFEHCDDRGLNPEDYDASRWQQRIADLRSKSAESTALFDTALTINAMRFISDLHVGRVNPKHFSFGINIDAKKLDLPAFLATQVIEASDVDGVVNSVEPQTLQYKALKDALRQYRGLLPQDNTEPVPLVTGKSVEPGKPYSGSAQVQAKLKLLGDEPATDPGTTDTTTYDRALVDAVKHFQHRHGLAEDGKLGKETTAALNVTIDTRINQITDTLERWRWLSDEYLNATLMVNLPEFILRGYAGPDHKLDFTMRVVDGIATPEHRTPVLADHMRYLIFRPFWNVPVGIAKKELVPHILANANYLSEKNYEAVDRKGNHVTANVNQIAHGMVMVREKPGPTNSLGLVKFMFPNQFDVYLHSTPSVSLFQRTRRDYSHGCVRVQEPVKLATWLLQDNPKWDEDKIKDAMENGQDNKTAMLPHPIPIVIFYATAFIDEDGEIHFFNDIYTYDKMLEDALKHGPPYPQKPVAPVVQADV